MSQNVDNANISPAMIPAFHLKGMKNGSEGKLETDSPDDRVLKRGDLARVIDQ